MIHIHVFLAVELYFWESLPTISYYITKIKCRFFQRVFVLHKQVQSTGRGDRSEWTSSQYCIYPCYHLTGPPTENVSGTSSKQRIGILVRLYNVFDCKPTYWSRSSGLLKYLGLFVCKFFYCRNHGVAYIWDTLHRCDCFVLKK